MRQALRNAGVLVLRHPIFTLTYAMVAVALLVMTVAVPYFWMSFTAGLLIFFYTCAVHYLGAARKRTEPPP